MQPIPLDSFNQFLTEVRELERQITDPESQPDMEKVERFIQHNHKWLQLIAEHPSANREPVEQLCNRLIQIESPEGSKVANLIGTYLTRNVSLHKDALKEVLRHTGQMTDPTMRRTMANTARVSKTWKVSSDEARIDLINENHLKLKDLGFKSAEDAINFLIKSKDRVKYVNFEELPITNEQFKKLTENCTNLTHIEIPKGLQHFLHPAGGISGDSLKYLANTPNLQSLDITGCAQLEPDALKHLANTPNLQSLNISGCRQLDHDSLEHLANTPKLQSLDISYCEQLEPDALKHLAKIPNLQSLDISVCEQLEPDALKHLANTPNLKFFRMTGCDRLEPDALKHLANTPKLQSLDITGCAQLESDALKHLAKTPNLQSLNISGCAQLDEPDALKHLANTPNLKFFQMTGCDRLEPDALKHLARTPNLQSLGISGCEQLEPDALKHLANTSNLQSLTMCWCRQLESDALKHLANTPNLQSLDISYCTQFENREVLKPLANKPNLKFFQMTGCDRLATSLRLLNSFQYNRNKDFIFTGRELEYLLRSFNW